MKRQTILATCMLIGLGCCTDQLWAQQVITTITLTPTKPANPTLAVTSTDKAVVQAVPPGALNPVGQPPAAVPAAAAQAATETLEQKKVTLALAAKFDRTAASVLKAWSDGPKEEQAKKEEAAKEESASGIVRIAYEGFAVFELEGDSKFKIGDKIELAEDEQSFGIWKLLSVEGTKVSAQRVDEKKKAAEQADIKDKSKANTNTKADDKKADVDAGGKVTDTKESENKEDKDEAAKEATKDGVEPNAEEAADETVDNKTDEANDPAAATLELSPGDKVVLTPHVEPKESKPDVDKQAQAEVDEFERNVILGNWAEVKTFLAEIKADEADKIYAHVLKSLSTAPKVSGKPPARGQKPATPMLSPEDILQVADASPKPIKFDLGEEEDSETEGDAEQPANAAPAVVVAPAAAVVNLPPGVVLPPGAVPALATGQPVVAGQPQPDAAAVKTNHIDGLALLIGHSQRSGHNFADFYEQVKTGTTHFGGDDTNKKLAAAELFMKSNMMDFVEVFLPPLDAEDTPNNLPALKIWSQLALSKYSTKSVAEWLEKAWKINQWIIATKDLKTEDRDLALTNLLELSSKIDKEVGVEWINASFTEMPERGKTILTNLGTQSSDLATKASQIPESTRLDLLRLQNESVEKLIELSPDQAKEWRPALTLLAQNWLVEAATTLQYSQQSSRGSNMNIDMYGNYYWMNQNQRQSSGGRKPRPIKVSDMLEIAPSETWQGLIHESLHTSLRRKKAELYLRVNEEDKAFPFIEQIAETHSDIGRDLVHEFLRTWTRNHDPNSSKRQRNPYIYFYGFDRKAEAIPLTRSQQERNLNELADWVTRIRKLPIDDVEEQLLADAFTNCHSSAEVFELDRFRDVFGDLSKLKPETIGAITQKMRASLSANWRDIRTQEQKQTNRREPEVQQAVLDGYRTASTLIKESLQSSPDNWQLHLAQAMLMFDQNAYDQLVQKSSEFSDRRDAAFDQFQVAADKYADVVSTLEEKDQSTQMYDFWFYAALGACDLGKITNKTVPDLKQYAKIRAAIEALPAALSESHMAKFANNLFTRMSPIKPEIKFRYLRGGFEIAGDHPRAWEAKNLFAYYKDLVHEIKLDIAIDGADKVGSGQTFGAYVNILHTDEIERESGGFGKYAQNQNSMMYAYNYGRPTEDYRDKFTDSVEQALGEHFEVQSITFQKAENMKSRETAKPGWKVTPYAYVLLKPKGPEVDRIAPLKLDLDFLDTSGYVVIPIESPALVVDCSEENVPMRPVSDLKVTQTLDERQAADGKLIVEISASGKGLVPDLEDIMDVERDNFEVVSVDDQPVLPTEFDAESNEIQILSERSWTVEYKATDAASELTEFSFSEAKLDGAESKFQRYEDADLVEVSQAIELEKNYSVFSWSFLYWLIPLVVLGLFGLSGLIYATSRPEQVVEKRFNLPEDINPFTVLTLLRDIKERNGISNEQGVELQNSINRVEQYYFSQSENVDAEDLEQLAKTWVRQAQ